MSNIRFYIEEDYDELIKILKDANSYDEVWETRENLKRKIEKDVESIIVYEIDDKIIGCVFIMEDGWNGFIWRLAVKQDYRRQGIGKTLIGKAEEIIKSRGIKESSILVNVNNEELQNWYQRQNYKKGRNWTFMYKKLDE